jgi:hypothetical protein
MRSLLIITQVLILVCGFSPCSAQPNERYSGTAGRGPSGPNLQGFALALAADSPNVRMGDPVWVTLELRNISGSLGHASVGSRNDDYEFTIVNRATGETVARNPHPRWGNDSIGGGLLGFGVPAGTSVYLRFKLDALYEFTGPGTYSVQVTGTHLTVGGHPANLHPSNTVLITMT